MHKSMIKRIFSEYGFTWVINRSLYSGKLKMMAAVPVTEKLFEKKVNIKKVNVFHLDPPILKRFLENLPNEEKEKILKLADNAIEGVLQVFSSIELDYGNPINWHYDPLTKKETAKNIKWHKIPDFDKSGSDIKTIWEASRFTHFYYFTRAYLISGDEKYYYAFSSQLSQWLSENPYSFGANYKCGQESALRMINVLMAYTVFRFYEMTTETDEISVKKLVVESYKKILSNFFYAHKCIKNNHTLSELCGIIIGAWCCNDEKKLKHAYRLLDKEIRQQFLNDGGYIQYSFNYQRLAFQILECILKLTEVTGLEIEEHSKELLKKSVLLMYQMQDESGVMPNYGANDGALIFPVTVCDYTDYRSTLNSMYTLLSGKRLYGGGNYDEELLWFGNATLIEAPVAEIKRTAALFPEAGLYSLRHQGGFLMTCLQTFKSRPAHMDQQHIDLWDKGVNLFCDSGTFSYADKSARDLVLTAAHNTVKAKDLEQMKKHGAFLIFDWTKCNNVEHSPDGFAGTMISKNGYTHRRMICKKEQGYLLHDEVSADIEYCEFNFHTPCEVRIIPNGFQLFSKEEIVCKVSVDNGELFLKRAYRSRYYLKKEEITCVSIRCNMKNKKCNLTTDVNLSDKSEVS